MCRRNSFRRRRPVRSAVRRRIRCSVRSGRSETSEHVWGEDRRDGDVWSVMRYIQLPNKFVECRRALRRELAASGGFGKHSPADYSYCPQSQIEARGFDGGVAFAFEHNAQVFTFRCNCQRNPVNGLNRAYNRVQAQRPYGQIFRHGVRSRHGENRGGGNASDAFAERRGVSHCRRGARVLRRIARRNLLARLMILMRVGERN